MIVGAPAVSCILPVYNQARFLPDALKSVVAQTIPVAEIIVVDDGSTDDLREVEERFRHIARFVHQDNKGPAAARNAGVKLAGCEWLCFLDADDLWHPEKLERQLAAFRDDPALDYCLTYQRNFWEPDMAAEEQAIRAHGHPITRDHPGYVMQTMLLHRETFLRVGPLDEALKVHEDSDWILRAQDIQLKRRILDKVLLYRRLHENNLSYTCLSPQGIEDRTRLVLEHVARRRRASS